MKKNKTGVCFDRLLQKDSDPVMLRRSYDISVACCHPKRENDAPMELSLRGEAECPLLRAACVTAAVAVGVCIACKIGKCLSDARCRRHYQKKYREQLREQKFRAAKKDAGENAKDAAEKAVKAAEKAAKQAQKAAENAADSAAKSAEKIFSRSRNGADAAE